MTPFTSLFRAVDRSKLRRRALTRVGFVVPALVSLAIMAGVAAAPKKGGGEKGQTPNVQAVDPVVAKRITARALSVQEKRALKKRVSPVATPPKFELQRLSAPQKAELLGTSDPAALTSARFDARHTYHDDNTYMEILAYGGGHVGVRTLRNYLHFNGAPEVMASASARPSVVIHFRAQANTRYLIECAVDGAPATTFSASDNRGEYSVHTDERATLLYLREQGGASEDVAVQVAGNTPGWYLDGCELTSNPS